MHTNEDLEKLRSGKKSINIANYGIDRRFFVVLDFKLRASHLLGRHSST
jgi:hypothetical protein